MNNCLWVDLSHPDVMKDKYKISEMGEIKEINNDKSLEVYHANNGYDYILLLVDPVVREHNMNIYPSPIMPFRIDILVGITFVKVDPNLTNKSLDIIHLDNDTHNCQYYNLKWAEDIEEWRDVEYEDIIRDKYQISNHGRIRDKNTKEILHQRLDKYGYCMITLKLNNPTEGGYYSKPFKTHRIVANAWYGVSSSDVNHIDGVHNNNYYKNLEYTTRLENLDHAIKTGLRETIPAEQIEMIYDLLAKYTRPKFVYENMIDHDKYPRITYSLVKAVKRGFYDHKIDMTNRKPLTKMFTQSIHKINLSVDEIDELRELIIKWDNSSTNAYKHIDHKRFPNVNETCMKAIKFGRAPYDKSNKFTKEQLDEIKYSKSLYKYKNGKAKFDPEKIDKIRTLLNETGGSPSKVLKLLNDPLVTKHNVQSIKQGVNKAHSEKYDLSFNDGKYPFIEK